MNTTLVIYFGQPMTVACDRQCDKAWGINNRPRKYLSANEDDYEFLADGELGNAPVDPGTYEGDHAKPLRPSQFPNKWCVRECERCSMSRPNEFDKPLKLYDYSQRVYNKPQ